MTPDQHRKRVAETIAAAAKARVAVNVYLEDWSNGGQHPDWPRLRIGVNSGEVVVSEIGGDGHGAYALLGDTVNTGSRLESLAPAGGVLIGAGTHARLPAGVQVEARTGLRMKGKEDPVTAYVLLALP